MTRFAGLRAARLAFHSSRHPGFRRGLGWLICALVAGSAAGSQRFRIAVRDDGVYGVTYESLVAAGLLGQPESAGLALSIAGQPQGIRVEDGGDGRFGPGDQLELVGRHLAGAVTWYDPYSPYNVYVLDTEGTDPTRLREPAGGGGAPTPSGDAPLIGRHHLEQNAVLLRFSQAQVGKEHELWYWAKLSQIDPEPFRVALPLADLAPAAARPVEIRVRLRGWSRPAVKPTNATADHRVDVTLDGAPLGYGEWNNGDGAYDLVLPPVPASRLIAGAHELALRVPKRPGAGSDPIVDVAVVDWVEVVYPRRARLGSAQSQIELEGDAGSVSLVAPGRSRLALYGDDGTRHVGRLGRPGAFAFGPLVAGTYTAVADGGLLAPASVALDTLSTLASDDHRADYIVVTTADLRPALGPLLELRRSEGLAVETVDIQDVYDEFHHGIPHPAALRDFIAHAYRDWRKPAPRFVLLVGDASWDLSEHPEKDVYPDAAYSPGHGTVFAYAASTPYPAKEIAHRNLIPTWSYDTHDGHAAGDNWFVAVDGDDELPELAIGRFPVTTRDEVAAIVRKTVAYETSAPMGAWRRNVLWISNEDVAFQSMSDRLAEQTAKLGYSAEKIYAKPGVASGAAEQAAIRTAIERGPLLVHFVGHGGRFIWRTGPPDWTKHRDLFNLDDVAALAPGDRLPVVLAMTCYSAPFDHPTADSIGEKFLREPGRGAVAVIAASWRNAPAFALSKAVVDELLAAPTVGEALARAKRASRSPELVEQYNLLGDPALRLQRPQLSIAIEPTRDAGGRPAFRAEIGAPFSGRAAVDWLDAAGASLRSEELAVSGPRFEAAFPGDAASAEAVASVRIYAWDQRSGVDAVGELGLVAAPGTGTKR
jgi:hypothetical protein